jgi:CubicO group peptidase (beta-lactamase class C family)
MEYAGSWSTDLEHPPFEKMLVGINARAIDFAKFGMLMLKDGLWNAQQLVSEQWVREATQDEEKPAGYYRQDADFFADGHYYKYFWWGDRRSAGKSDFHAAGNRGQYIYISPEKKVVIVRTGFDYGIATGRWVRLFRQLADNL